MWEIYIIIIVLIIFGFLFFCNRNNSERTETYEKNKLGIFPKFPREMNSEFHHDILKERLAVVPKCGKCQELEQKLFQDGEKAISQNNRYYKPDLQTQYKSYIDCEMCRLLLQTWNRYFIVIQDMSNYIYDKKLPREPEIVQMKCKGCNDIQKKDKEYADNLKKELACRASGTKGCKHVKFTGGPYDFDKNCKDCEQVYNTWQQYIFSLIAIINYLKPLS